MNITNHHNLPDAIYSAVSQMDREQKENVFSATTLILPPQIYQLRQKCGVNIIEDASDRLWALLGTCVHAVLDKHSGAGVNEERLSVEIDGVTITGQPDLITGNEIHDYKVTSTWTVIFDPEGKKEWEEQLNIYRWLYFKSKGILADRLIIYAILRDWQASKAKADANYPQIPFAEIEMKVWDVGEAEQFIMGKVIELQADAPRPCTMKEQWAKDTKYAIMKKDRKSAIKVCDSRGEAELLTSDGQWVEERPGVRTRCEGYCNVKDFCPQYKEEHK